MLSLAVGLGGQELRIFESRTYYKNTKLYEFKPRLTENQFWDTIEWWQEVSPYLFGTIYQNLELQIRRLVLFPVLKGTKQHTSLLAVILIPRRFN